MSVGDHFHQPSILLGTGGTSPGLIAYDVESARITRLLSLPPGQSVYAVGLSPDGSTIVVGTKAGAVHWLRRQDEGAEGGHYVQETQAAGSARSDAFCGGWATESRLRPSPWVDGRSAPCSALTRRNWRGFPCRGSCFCGIGPAGISAR